MATYKTDLATSQEAALLDSSKLANDGTTHTGVLKVSTGRVTLTGGILAGGHLIQGLYLPPGARVIPALCEVIVGMDTVETDLDYVAHIKYRDSDEIILQTSYTTPTRYVNNPKAVDAEFADPKTSGQWIDVDFNEQNGTDSNFYIDIYVAYVGI